MNLSSDASRFVPLVRSLVSKTLRTLGPELEEEELVKLGLNGLAEGFAEYKSRQGLTQRDYLIYRIREAIYGGIRTHIWPTEVAREKYLFLKKTNELLFNFHLSAEGAVKRSMKAETAEVLYLLKLLTTVALLCKSKKKRDEEMEGLPDPPSMEGELIHYYYDDDLNLAQVAERMRISEPAASRLHLKILDKLADQFCRVHE